MSERSRERAAGDPALQITIAALAATVIGVITALLVTADGGSLPAAIISGGASTTGIFAIFLSVLKHLST